MYRAPLIIGIGGALILFCLGIWQLDRLSQKQNKLQEVIYRLQRPSIPFETIAATQLEINNYQPVSVTGHYIDKAVYVLTSVKPWGAGFQQIVPFQTATQTILVERGFIPEAQKNDVLIPLEKGEITLDAILYRPQETGYFTPPPDVEKNIWFARNVEAMAQYLEAAPVLAVIKPPPEVKAKRAPQALAQYEKWPRPIITDARSIPNNHLQYAITWFSMGLIWLVMSAIWVRRIHNNIKYFN